MGQSTALVQTQKEDIPDMAEMQKRYPQNADTIESQNVDRIFRDLKEGVEAEQVSPLDPDFLAVSLPLAIALDILGILSALLYFTVIVPIIATIVSILVGTFVTLWMWWRTKRIENAIQRAKEILEQTAASGGSKAKTAVRTARYAYIGRKFLAKALLRVGLAGIAKLLPFLGFIPFWTIFVLLTVRETKKLADGFSAEEPPKSRPDQQRLSSLATPPPRSSRPETETEDLSEDEEGLETGQTAYAQNEYPLPPDLQPETEEEAPGAATPPTDDLASQSEVPLSQDEPSRPSDLVKPPPAGPRQTGETRRKRREDSYG